MEILRFDESETPAPKRKRASKGWVAVGLVATLMGVSTAFASSTVNINTDNTASLGQGVVKVTTCDNHVNLIPVATSTVDGGETPTFRTTSVNINEISETCNGNDFGIQVYEKYISDPDEYREDQPTKLVQCAKLNVVHVSGSVQCVPGTDPGTTDTIWVNLGSGMIGPNNDYSFLLNAPSGIEYLTLVSSSHDSSRF